MSRLDGVPRRRVLVPHLGVVHARGSRLSRKRDHQITMACRVRVWGSGQSCCDWGPERIQVTATHPGVRGSRPWPGTLRVEPPFQTPRCSNATTTRGPTRRSAPSAARARALPTRVPTAPELRRKGVSSKSSIRPAPLAAHARAPGAPSTHIHTLNAHTYTAAALPRGASRRRRCHVRGRASQLHAAGSRPGAATPRRQSAPPPPAGGPASSSSCRPL